MKFKIIPMLLIAIFFLGCKKDEAIVKQEENKDNPGGVKEEEQPPAVRPFDCLLNKTIKKTKDGEVEINTKFNDRFLVEKYAETQNGSEIYSVSYEYDRKDRLTKSTEYRAGVATKVSKFTHEASQVVLTIGTKAPDFPEEERRVMTFTTDGLLEQVTKDTLDTKTGLWGHKEYVKATWVDGNAIEIRRYIVLSPVKTQEVERVKFEYDKGVNMQAFTSKLGASLNLEAAIKCENSMSLKERFAIFLAYAKNNVKRAREVELLSGDTYIRVPAGTSSVYISGKNGADVSYFDETEILKVENGFVSERKFYIWQDTSANNKLDFVKLDSVVWQYSYDCK